ncbi:MAG: hypothetical protein M3P10_07150 [Actinomycetota bacterium]|nr:hypothetical protein [Actinomycetota bacterium]
MRDEAPARARGRQRLLAALLAFGVSAAAGIFAWTAFSSQVQDSRPATPVPSGPPPAVDLSTLPEGWTELAAPPEIRTGAAQVWTGSELLVWGGTPSTGSERPENDGIAYVAATDSWEEIPPAPIAARSYAASAWTGTELLVWGGWDGSWSGNEPGTLGDGAAYDPATHRWRELPPAPIDARVPLFAWTGDELIVWGTSFRTDDRPLDGAAYEPASDSWRSIADGPIELTDATGAWTGSEMIVFGAALHGGNFPETPTAIGAAYDPSADTWRELPASDIDPNANTANWLAGRLIAWDYSEHTSAYSPDPDTWTSLAGPPVDACEDTPQGVSADGFIFGELCAEQIIIRPGEDRWHNVTRRDLPFTPGGFAAAGGVVLVFGYEGEFFDQSGPLETFAYRPPSSFECGGFGESGGDLAAAVAARFELLRSDRPEALARPEIADLLSASGEATYSAPETGLEGLFTDVAIDRVLSVQPASDGEGFVVEVRMWDLNGNGKVIEELTLRPGRNLAGDDCQLVVDDARLSKGTL